ncbi:MAG TPA: tripartite tricarboxylate transporter substrate binding protein [Burkholderiales bacterium]
MREFPLVLILVSAAALAAPAAAQEFPSSPVRFVVPLPAGGTMDIIARTLGQPVARALGQNVIVDNRPGGGGGGIIGTEAVARAPADGHTVLFIGNGFTMNPALRAKLPFDAEKDFTAVARVASNPLVVSVHPSLPAKSLKQLVALARAHPGELTFASGTAAGGLRLNAERFKAAAGIDIVNVPYQGGAPAVAAVLGGHTPILIVNVSETVPHVPSGRLRPLAVTSLERNRSLMEVPTVAESGYPGFEALMWYGVVARAAVPRGAIDRLSAEITRAVRLPEVSDALDRKGLSVATMGTAEFDSFIRAEIRSNGRIIREINLRVE